MGSRKSQEASAMKLLFLLVFAALLFAALSTMGCSPALTPAPPVVTVVYPTQIAPTDTPAPTNAPTQPALTRPTAPSAPAARRISFAPGSISATVQGTTRAIDVDHWVIAAQVGQTMTVYLIMPQGGQAALAIYGADGTMLISDHAGAMQWMGALPKTQDYFIDVKPETGAMSYTLQVTIPPR